MELVPSRQKALTELKVLAALGRLHEKFRDFPTDLTVRENYTFVQQGVAEIRTIRTGVEKRRKELVEDAVAWQREVNGVAKEVTAKLLELEEPMKSAKAARDEEVKNEREAKKRAEEERVDNLLLRVNAIRATVAVVAKESSVRIAEQIAELEDLEIGEDFQEYRIRAKAAREETLVQLRELLAAARAKEEREAELAKQEAKLEAERAALKEQQEKDAKEKAAKDAEEARVKGIKERMDELSTYAAKATMGSLEQINGTIRYLKAVIPSDFQEFEGEVVGIIQTALELLTKLKKAAEKREQEAVEAKRLDGLRAKLSEITTFAVDQIGKSSEQVASAILKLKGLNPSDFQEFEDEAKHFVQSGLNILNQEIDAAKRREEQQLADEQAEQELREQGVGWLGRTYNGVELTDAQAVAIQEAWNGVAMTRDLSPRELFKAGFLAGVAYARGE